MFKYIKLIVNKEPIDNPYRVSNWLDVEKVEDTKKYLDLID